MNQTAEECSEPCRWPDCNCQAAPRTVPSDATVPMIVAGITAMGYGRYKNDDYAKIWRAMHDAA
jgi:hypothetical protein